MKCWMPTLIVLMSVSAANAEEVLLPPDQAENVNEYTLDFSQADFFAVQSALPTDLLPPPASQNTCPDGACPLELAKGCQVSGSPGCPIPSFAIDVFATLAAATEIESCAQAKCACGDKCGCKSGDKTNCACGDKCACAKDACKCGTNCQCSTKSRGKCACGPNCKCGTTTIAKQKGSCCPVAKCNVNSCCATKCKVAKCNSDKCGCGADCNCGAQQVADLKQELVMMYHQMKFQEHVADIRAENQSREQQLLLELAEVRAHAAAQRATLDHQMVAQRQQHELVSQIVKLASGSQPAKPAVDANHLRQRVEQLTIENVQLRHTIEELRQHVEQLAREPLRSRDR